MSRQQFAMRQFFRDAPINLLERYFKGNGWLTDFDFSGFQAGNVEPLYRAWEALPDEARAQSEETFREIDALACEGGIKAILDDAEFWGKREELLAVVSALDSWHERSFTIFLDHPQYWKVATAFFHADTIGKRYWRKCKNLPAKPAKVEDANRVAALEANLVHYFTTQEGRGKKCKVEVYRRGTLEYFFAYPEDHPRKPLMWKGRELKPQLETPAFEIIFVFDAEQGSLDIYIDGDRRIVPELQKIFAGIMLDFVLTGSDKDARIYDLEPLKSPDIQFHFSPESGILGVAVKKLRLSLQTRPVQRIILEATPTPENPRAVYDMLDKLEKSYPKAAMKVTQVGIVVTFAGKDGGRPTTRSFDLGWPNSCSLARDEKGEIIRKMLVDSNLEPRWPGM